MLSRALYFPVIVEKMHASSAWHVIIQRWRKRMSDNMTGPEATGNASVNDHSASSESGAGHAEGISVQENISAASPHQDTHADPVIPVAPNPVARLGTSTELSSDAGHMDRASVKELAQMLGAMMFVALLTAVGWHAAHYSGAWPY
ncbi:hypothetical protein GOB93_18270 [Acetobacter musti]|uniref:Uncharacterized protein n=1 Tax=Acetobacter musti TaxID=864732 RepID=A0ABX0JYH7_9PROT|nr:hypothetical protein [Acetobacter musti]NHN86559.1 hypothetical protein [Acetobacter musti]